MVSQQPTGSGADRPGKHGKHNRAARRGGQQARRTGKHGTPEITAEVRLHARAVLGRDIVRLLGGHPVAINPHDLITAVVPAEHLLKALADERR